MLAVMRSYQLFLPAQYLPLHARWQITFRAFPKPPCGFREGPNGPKPGTRCYLKYPTNEAPRYPGRPLIALISFLFPQQCVPDGLSLTHIIPRRSGLTLSIFALPYCRLILVLGISR